MDQTAGFATQLADAARSMHGGSSTQETLDKVVSVATELIHGCDLVGISVVHRGGIDTPAASDEELRRIDELQFELKEGPCYDALRTHETVCSGDLAGDARWPRWGPLVAAEVGARQHRELPALHHRGHARRPEPLRQEAVDAFDDDDVYDGYALAAHVAVALAAAEHVEHLETAINNRTVIGRAEGILMERFDITPAQAFAVLRRVSQRRNVRLYRVADELVRTRQTPSRPAASTRRCVTRWAAPRPGGVGVVDPEPALDPAHQRPWSASVRGLPSQMPCTSVWATVCTGVWVARAQRTSTAKAW